MDITQQKGLTTFTHCVLDFTELGYGCLIPIDSSSKYDLVVDLDGKLIKIQCKTATWTKESQRHKAKQSFYIMTCHQTTNSQRTTRYKYSEQEVDYFYTWFEGQGYLVSIKEAKGVGFSWRYEYPSTNQKKVSI